MKKALSVYFILLVAPLFARRWRSFPERRDAWEKFTGERRNESLYANITSEVEKKLEPQLPEHFHWNRVDNQSVGLGWDAGALANVKADKIKLTARYFANPLVHKDVIVPIGNRNLTLEGLRPSTYYGIVLEGFSNEQPVFTYFSYIKTKGNGAASCYLRGGRFCLSFPVFGALEVQQWPVIVFAAQNVNLSDQVMRNTELPKPFRWNRVGSKSVELELWPKEMALILSDFLRFPYSLASFYLRGGKMCLNFPVFMDLEMQQCLLIRALLPVNKLLNFGVNQTQYSVYFCLKHN
ncbi:hypothetical protein TcWFU_006176 [Taenia crassiceps]|uniref:Fibronectin type-III domain-containing protein n=1 Tax=Taenia crassiceps TaxID=6207 RepID=A0ABR4Q4J2_9CEST